jgi:hypothetical protein
VIAARVLYQDKFCFSRADSIDVSEEAEGGLIQVQRKGPVKMCETVRIYMKLVNKLHKHRPQLVNTMNAGAAPAAGSVIRPDVEADEQKSERVN